MDCSIFENMCIPKFDTHRILSCIVFVDCQLKLFSILLCWIVIVILDLWHFESFQANTSKLFGVLSVDFYLNRQVMINMIDIISSFSTKKRFWVSKNIVTQILVTSNHMPLQSFFCMNSNCGFVTKETNN